MKIKRILLGLFLVLFSCQGFAEEEDRVDLKTTFIKGNKELPQVLYIVPWQDFKQEKTKQETMILHSLFGDIFDPVTAKDLKTFLPTNSKKKELIR